MGRQQQQQQQASMVMFLVAVLVVSAMHAVPAEAGRALATGGVAYGTLNPGSAPAVPRGQPYTGRGKGCSSVYQCRGSSPSPPAGGAP